MTISEWVVHCRDALENAGTWYGHGTDNAQDEAAWLVLSAIGVSPDGSFNDWDQQATARQSELISALLEKRISSRKPLAYLTGEAWFCGLRFIVNENVLVPRSPIAELIQARYAPWVEADGVSHMLDMCTGCACIGIASAVNMPWCQVDAVDISPQALEVAASNRELHQLEKRLNLFESDLFDQLPGRQYDLIVSNPPYVGHADYESLPSEYHAEPELGLVSSMEGLELPLRIILDSADFLAPKGVLICEVGENASRLQSALPDFPFTWLEFAQGGGGVFLAGRQDLINHSSKVLEVMEMLSDVA